MPASRSPAPERLRLAIATAGGAGLVPFAPGTVGSLVGVALHAALVAVGGAAAALAGAAVVTALGFWSAGAGERRWGKDPGAVVIDEVAGQMIALAWLPAEAWSLALGFALFRTFDILKPPPIRRLEAVRGGAGIMLDDLLAGCFANLAVRIVMWFLER